MADDSEEIAVLVEQLGERDLPGWSEAPVLDGWCWQAVAEKSLKIVGRMDGKLIVTAEIGDVSRRRPYPQWARTIDRHIFRLGWPYGTTSTPLPEVWPPLLAVAACKDWFDGFARATMLTGRHTMSPIVHAHVVSLQRKDLIWSERRETQIATVLNDEGRGAVADAWRLLSCDPDDGRAAAAMAAILSDELAVVQREREPTSAEWRAVRGWHRLAKLPPADRIASEADWNDPIAAAQFLGGLSAPQGIPQEVDLGPEQDDQPADGVVVLKAVGGVDTQWSGREVGKVFAPIAGKRLPVTPSPDTAAARRALAAEFPYAARQIDVILGDMVGASSARIRPTLLVGPPGCGKSRLARRIGEVSGLRVVRYDGAGASDSAFGGTARRWSTGEPSVPVAALLAAKRADALLILDEVEKAGTGRHNGNFANALLPFLEAETARCYPDPYAQAEVDVSRVNFIATANDELLLPGPLRDRFRALRIPPPSIEDLPALCRGVVGDLVRESGADPAWMPDLDGDEIDAVAQLWKGGSVRRLRDVVARLVVRRAEMPRH